jgi:hypothetical protein
VIKTKNFVWAFSQASSAVSPLRLAFFSVSTRSYREVRDKDVQDGHQRDEQARAEAQIPNWIIHTALPGPAF